MADTRQGDIGEYSDVKAYENVSSWPTASYPEHGTFGYPISPLPDNICGPTGPTGPVPPPPPVVTNVTDDAGAVVSPQIPLDPTKDVYIRVNGSGFVSGVPQTELQFSGVQYNHQWPIEVISATQLRTLITPANSGGVAGIVEVRARNVNVVSTGFGTFSFTAFP